MYTRGSPALPCPPLALTCPAPPLALPCLAHLLPCPALPCFSLSCLSTCPVLPVHFPYPALLFPVPSCPAHPPNLTWWPTCHASPHPSALPCPLISSAHLRRLPTQLPYPALPCSVLPAHLPTYPLPFPTPPCLAVPSPHRYLHYPNLPPSSTSPPATPLDLVASHHSTPRTLLTEVLMWLLLQILKETVLELNSRKPVSMASCEAHVIRGKVHRDKGVIISARKLLPRDSDYRENEKSIKTSREI